MPLQAYHYIPFNLISKIPVQTEPKGNLFLPILVLLTMRHYSYISKLRQCDPIVGLKGHGIVTYARNPTVTENKFYNTLRGLNIGSLVFLTLITFFYTLPTNGQGVISQKYWSYTTFDGLSNIMKWDTSTYFATGFSNKYGYWHQQSSTFARTVLLYRLNKNLDTVWRRNIEAYGYSIKLVKFGNKLVLTVGTTYSTISNQNTSAIEILELDTAGTLLRRIPYNASQYRYGPSGMFISSDSCYVVYGDITPSMVRRGRQCDWFLLKFNPRTSITEFERFYNPSASFACGCYAEQTPDKGYLISGTADNKVAYQRLDSLGDSTGRVQYAFQALNRGAAYNAGIYQHPSGNLVFTVTPITSNSSQNTLGMINTSNQLLWQRTVVSGFSFRPKINSDGSIFDLASRPNPYTNNIRKTAPDSTIIWQVPINTTVPNSPFAFYDCYYESDSSAVMVGFTQLGGQNARSFYLARLSNIGRPYSPLSLAGGPRADLADVVAYPNPTTDGTIQLRGLTQEANLQVYTTTGQLLFETGIMPGQQVQLQNTSPGLYFWRATNYAGVMAGRVVVR